MKFIKISMILTILFSIFGCTHDLRIKNIATYQNLGYNQLNEKSTIGIIADVDNLNHKKIIRGVAEKLIKLNTTPILPYTYTNTHPVDYIVKININSNYKGSWVNYFIDFPGFLIWTPTWNGYIYKINHNVKITLIDGKTKQEISQFNIPLNFDVRQADIDRTWIENSWFECGAIAFVGGFFHTRYDEDVTAMVTNEVYYPIGRYIAEEIKNNIKINKYNKRR